MKYIVIELQNNADETLGNFVFAFDNREDAEAKYHTIAAAAAKSDVLVHAVTMLTRNGGMVKNESYTHAAEEEA